MKIVFSKAAEVPETLQRLAQQAQQHCRQKGKVVVEGYSRVKGNGLSGHSFLVNDGKPWKSSVDIFVPTDKFGETKPPNMFLDFLGKYRQAYAEHLEIEKRRVALEESGVFTKILKRIRKGLSYDLARPFKKTA